MLDTPLVKVQNNGRIDVPRRNLQFIIPRRTELLKTKIQIDHLEWIDKIRGHLGGGYVVGKGVDAQVLPGAELALVIPLNLWVVKEKMDFLLRTWMVCRRTRS